MPSLRTLMSCVLRSQASLLRAFRLPGRPSGNRGGNPFSVAPFLLLNLDVRRVAECIEIEEVLPVEEFVLSLLAPLSHLFPFHRLRSGRKNFNYSLRVNDGSALLSLCRE